MLILLGYNYDVRTATIWQVKWEFFNRNSKLYESSLPDLQEFTGIHEFLFARKYSPREV